MRKKTKEEILEQKRMDSKMKIRHVCDCGHTVYIPEYKEKVICNYCWKTVYKNEKIKFKYKLQDELRKAKQKEVFKNANM